MKNANPVAVGMLTAGPVAFKIGIETMAEGFLGVVKVDEDEQVKTLIDEELSNVFRAVSSFLLSSVRCFLNAPGQLHKKVLKQATDVNLPYEVRIYPRLVVNSSDYRQDSIALRTSEWV